jgi:hypothetical protein
MPSSGILRHVALVDTDVLEECITSIIRVTRIGELGTTLAATNNRNTLRRNTANVPSSPILAILMMKAIHSNETSILTRATTRNVSEDCIIHNDRCKNCISYIQEMKNITANVINMFESSVWISINLKNNAIDWKL